MAGVDPDQEPTKECSGCVVGPMSLCGLDLSEPDRVARISKWIDEWVNTELDWGNPDDGCE